MPEIRVRARRDISRLSCVTFPSIIRDIPVVEEVLGWLPFPLLWQGRSPAISPIGRIFGIFFSPKATFDYCRKPGWLLPVIILRFWGLAVAIGLNQKMNWRGHEPTDEKEPAGLDNVREAEKSSGSAWAPSFAPSATYVLACLRR